MNTTLRYLTFCLFLLASPLSAYAVECEEKSPTYIDGEHPFVPVEVLALDSSMQSNLETLFKKIAGDWEGEGTEVDCIFEQGTAVKRESEVNVETSIDSTLNTLQIRTSVENTNQGVIDSHIRSLYIVDGVLRQDTAEPLGNVEILEIADSVLEYRYSWQSSGQNGFFTNEDFIRIEYALGHLTITRTHYTQGYFGQHSQWELQ